MLQNSHSEKENRLEARYQEQFCNDMEQLQSKFMTIKEENRRRQDAYGEGSPEA